MNEPRGVANPFGQGPFARARRTQQDDGLHAVSLFPGALAAAAQMALAEEPVIVAGHEMRFHLPHRIEHDAHDD